MRTAALRSSTWAPALSLAIVMVALACTADAEDKPLPQWADGDPWVTYKAQLTNEGFSNVVVQNLGGEVTDPVDDDSLKDVKHLDPDAGQADPIPLNTKIIVTVKRVPFPNDEDAAGRTVLEVREHLVDIGLAIGDLYLQGSDVPIPPPVDYGRPVIEFKKPVPKPKDLKVGEMVSVIVESIEPAPPPPPTTLWIVSVLSDVILLIILVFVIIKKLGGN